MGKSFNTTWSDSEESENTEKKINEFVNNHIALCSLIATKCFTVEIVGIGPHFDNRFVLNK